jgi:hypothetical protein
LGKGHTSPYGYFFGCRVLFEADCELSLAVGQIPDTQKSCTYPQLLSLRILQSVKQMLPWGIVGMVTFQPVLGLRMVIV